jgi:nicotinamide-nucleotide amidase
MLTNVPGSSAYFQGGVVAYSNEAKMKLLGVTPDTLKAHGAVSEQTAREMAEGCTRCFGADMGIAVTGIAGPDGGTREKPVGTVCFGLAHRDRSFSGMYRFWGNREQVKMNTAMMALDWIRRVLNDDPFLPGV